MKSRPSAVVASRALVWREPKREDDSLIPPPPESEHALKWYEALLRRALGSAQRCLLCGQPQRAPTSAGNSGKLS